MSAPKTRSLTAAEAATRLGVKLDTVYAYVSRGMLPRAVGAGRASRFDAAAVERLALRGRRSGEKPAAPLVVTTALTAVSERAIHYRGRDALELAKDERFERVAAWLWGMEGEATLAFAAPPAAVALARAAQSALPEEVLPLERLRVIVSVLASTDPLRYELSRAPVLAAARGLIAGLVDALPRAGGRPARGERLAARLWTRLCAVRARPPRLAALELALGLCADHGLSPSTLAVRIAAAQRADPYSVVQTGLGALSGSLQGAASLAAEELLDEVERGGDPSAAIGARLRRGQRIPGFGHAAHPAGDPRARALLGAVGRAFEGSRGAAAASALAGVMRERGLPPPNIDFALAALVRGAGMLRGASEAIMAIARVSGWIAHALEEYATPTRFPFRALYVGPEPSRPEPAPRPRPTAVDGEGAGLE